MKFIVSFILLIFFTSCSNNKTVYWCGDHACVNKKEREAFFKKTLTVEVKNINDDNLKNDSNVKKIQEQILINDKETIKEKKNIAKQAKINRKKEIQKKKERIKNEKILANKAKLEEKKKIRKEKKILNPLKQGDIINKNTDKFNQILKQITDKNITKPFPDINDIPN